jgi:hypothetical protein
MPNPKLDALPVPPHSSEMGERIPAVDPDLKGAVAAAVRGLNPIYAPKEKIVRRIKEDKCLKNLEAKIEARKLVPLPTQEELAAAKLVLIKARKAYLMLRSAKMLQNREVWRLEEKQRARVSYISKDMQRRAVEKLRTTIGIRFLDAPLLASHGRLKFRKSLARSENQTETEPSPPPLSG